VITTPPQSLREGTFRSSLLGISVVIALSTAVFAALHWRGIPLSPDGWAYWQAAVSLANGSGYRDFSGAALTAWPPLYSFYLSVWVRLLGATGLALVVANGVLIVGQSVLWFYIVCHIWHVESRERRSQVTLAVALYISIYVPLTLQAAHAANLGFLSVALMLLATWRVSQSSSRSRVWQWSLLAAAGATLALLAHNVNVALVIGCAAALLLIRHRSRSDLVAAASLVFIPVTIWLTVRWQLSQLGSHAVGIGIAAFSPLQYLHQMLLVVGNLIVPNPFGAAVVMGIALFVVCALLVWSPEHAAQHRDSRRFIAGFVLFGCIMIWVLFNVTLVTDPIGARFVGWVPILVVPAIMIYAARMNLTVFLVVSALVLAPNLHRIVTFTRIHADLRPTNKIGVLFPVGALISPDFISGTPVQTDQGLLIAPPR